MIHIYNNFPDHTPVPPCLQGLTAESLANLDWADPALGLAGHAWWPEETTYPEFSPATHRLGEETLTVGDGCVIVTYAVVALTPEELLERRAPEIASLKAQIAALDLRRIRPLAEQGPDDAAYLADLNAQIIALRAQLT